MAHENAGQALWNVPGTVTVQHRVDPEAGVACSIHNFWEDVGPARRTYVNGAYRAVQHADAIVFYLPLASVTLPAGIGRRLFVDANKSVAAPAVNVECHVAVSLGNEGLEMFKNSVLRRVRRHICRMLRRQCCSCLQP